VVKPLRWELAGRTIGTASNSWQKRGQDVHAVVADPLFVDPDHANFTLKPASPAYRIGFRPINLSHVGPLN
jgi:hypothetical protein